MEVSIKAAKKEELKDILKLDLELLTYEAKVDCSLKEPDEKIKAYEEKFLRERFDDKNSRIFVALNDSKLIGFCYGFIQKLDPNHKINPIGYLCNCYVLKEYRGFGIGKKLSVELINWFKSKGIKRVVLDVTEKNTLAVNVWKKMGFINHPWKRMCLDM